MWPLASDECYVSIDIEADGPIPGLHSMLSLGAAAFNSDGRRLATFSANLQPLPGASEDPRTMRWLASQSAAWEACHVNPQPPEKAIADFRRCRPPPQNGRVARRGRVPHRLRRDVGRVVPAAVCGRESIQAARARHQDGRDDRDGRRLPRDREVHAAAALALAHPTHARLCRGCHRAG